MGLLSEDEIDERLAGTQWRREARAIVADLELEGFAQAVAFVNRVAEVAEQANHHPDVLIHAYKRVRVTLSTHSAGGVTGSDLDLAGRIDELV